MDVLRCKGQVGYPPSVAIGASLGYPVMVYQSTALLLGECEGCGQILVQLEGTCAQAQKAGKDTEVTQRAKVGNCPRRTRPTHIAVLSRDVVGELSPYEARGVLLWMAHGPWAARSYAASLYAQD